METLQNEPVDVIFLDIHLPKLKGTDFLKTLQAAPHIIITSAYSEYALEGYELNVLDYLVKPIEFNRFLIAVNKLKQYNRVVQLAAVHTAVTERLHVYVNVNKKKVKIFIDEILYIESLKEYIKIFTRSKSIFTKLQMGQIEEMLTKNEFLRIHRSFIVAKNKIDAFTATDIEINGKLLPIGRSYKELVLTTLE